jgi:succinate-semialdehyde dehydrogenase/glutarate-semialdehyde dehydrogenase
VADLLEPVGVPPGVVNVVLPEPPADAVSAMLAHAAVRKLPFTGSTEVGTRLLAMAAPFVLRCSMEQGGNAPFLVLDDADVGAAVEAALVAKLRNTGAGCIAANRFYVHESVVDRFVDDFAKALAAQRVDHGLKPRATVGALVSEGERDKVAALVDNASAVGAAVVTGGRPPDLPGAFYLATLLTDFDRSAQIVNTEIFGPVAPIVTFADDADVVRWANDSRVGLMALRHDHQPGAGDGTSRAHRDQHGVGEPRPNLGPRCAVRRDQAEWTRQGRRLRGGRRVPGAQVRRRRLVTDGDFAADFSGPSAHRRVE